MVVIGIEGNCKMKIIIFVSFSTAMLKVLATLGIGFELVEPKGA